MSHSITALLRIIIFILFVAIILISINNNNNKSDEKFDLSLTNTNNQPIVNTINSTVNDLNNVAVANIENLKNASITSIDNAIANLTDLNRQELEQTIKSLRVAYQIVVENAARAAITYNTTNKIDPKIQARESAVTAVNARMPSLIAAPQRRFVSGAETGVLSDNGLTLTWKTTPTVTTAIWTRVGLLPPATDNTILDNGNYIQSNPGLTSITYNPPNAPPGLITTTTNNLRFFNWYNGGPQGGAAVLVLRTEVRNQYTWINSAGATGVITLAA
jgi:hypothetical protein